MPFRVIMEGEFKEVVAFLTLLRSIAEFQFDPIYKRFLEKDKKEALIVLQCNFRKLKTKSFKWIYVQAEDDNQNVINLSLLDGKIQNVKNGTVLIKGKLQK